MSEQINASRKISKHEAEKRERLVQQEVEKLADVMRQALSMLPEGCRVDGVKLDGNVFVDIKVRNPDAPISYPSLVNLQTPEYPH